jgi:hypothetical protein
MLEQIGWFALAYACISITVTLLMLVFANRAFDLGGPIGMARSAIVLIVALAGLIIWAGKSVAGGNPGRPDDEVKKTIRKTSAWLDGLKKEWDDSKRS